jgi:peptidoglycan hydrolase CwlO-like protein
MARRAEALRVVAVESTAGTGRRRQITGAVAGDVVRVRGRGFGTRPERITVRFDDIDVAPFVVPFDSRALLVICPLPAKRTTMLRVRVGARTSNAVKFTVARPPYRARGTGVATRELFGAVDQIAAIVAASARMLARTPDAPRELQLAAHAIDQERRTLQRFVELTMQWAPLQAELTFEPLRGIERLDELIDRSGFVSTLRTLMSFLGGTGGPFAAIGGVAVLFDVLDEAADTVATLAKDLAPYFELYVTLLHGLQNWIKGFAFSAEAGPVVAGADIEINPGDVISAMADRIEFVIQLITGGPADPLAEITSRLEQLEAKVDSVGSAIAVTGDGVIAIEEKADRSEEKLDRLESKSDKTSSDLELALFDIARLEVKADVTYLQIERCYEEQLSQRELISILETKADRIEAQLGREETKLDQIEAKADRMEPKLDRLEEKADRAEEKLDRAEEKLDRVEEKSDRVEEKLDRVEQKGDRAEEKLDRSEAKGDRAEAKLDLAEAKLDRAEGKLDRLEQKADRHEGKLDRLEAKADRQEGKLDRHELKLDRLVATPAEASIANQRGGSPRVTASIAAIGKLDGAVYLRVAVDVLRSDLDDLPSWSPWIPFGRPVAAAPLASVSVDLQYEEGSNTVLNAILSARDQAGRIYHRVLRGADHQALRDPTQWSDWLDFLAQP